MDPLLEALIDLTFNPKELRDRNGRWTMTTLQREIKYVVDSLEKRVSVDGGPNRRLMPQLSGVPIPGSKADKIPHGPGQEVDLTKQFEDELRSQGIEVSDTHISTSSLKPTQDQLVAAKVAGIATYMETASADDRVYEPIFVTKDDYVIDGHHRWAANAVLDRLDGTDRPMAVRQINMNQADALAAATKFMDEWGLPRAGMNNATTISKMANLSRATQDIIDLADYRALAKPGYTGPRRTSDAERNIAHALMRKGKTKSEAIRMARGLLNKAAKTGRWGDHGKASAKTRATAAGSLAQRKTF